MSTDIRSLYADDWQFTDGVVDCNYYYGASREFAGITPLATSAKVLKSDPIRRLTLQASAQGIAIESTDVTFVLWAKTLSATYLVAPKIDDIIEVFPNRFIIKSIMEALSGAQFICYCKASPKNVT